jgi:hypothetical protein
VSAAAAIEAAVAIEAAATAAAAAAAASTQFCVVYSLFVWLVLIPAL